MIEAARRATEARKGTIAVLRVTSDDPELLTLKALRLLQAGEIVFYDAGIAPQIVEMARRESAKIGCRDGDDIAARMMAEAQRGKRAVYLTRRIASGIDLAALRAAGIPIEFVPA